MATRPTFEKLEEIMRNAQASMEKKSVSENLVPPFAPLQKQKNNLILKDTETGSNQSKQFISCGQKLESEECSKKALNDKVLLSFDKFDENILEEWCQFLRNQFSIVIDWHLVLGWHRNPFTHQDEIRSRVYVHSNCSREIAYAIKKEHLPWLCHKYFFSVESFLPSSKVEDNETVISPSTLKNFQSV